MTNEYEWIDSSDECKREFGAGDALLGWVLYAAAVLYLIV
jgi:hypothetical protein